MIAAFGYPTAREEDAVRAVQAAFAVVQEISPAQRRDRGSERDRPAGAHGAVDRNGGGADRPRPVAPEDSLIGAALNLAARLQALAAPGEIVIDGPTQRLIGRRLETRSLGLKSLKGFARPIEVFVVEAAAEQASRLTYRLATVQTPFVNRTRERSHLNALVEQAVAGDAQVVSLVGEAEIGKSRLANPCGSTGSVSAAMPLRCNAARRW